MKEQKIEREPYTGEVLDLTKPSSEADSKSNQRVPVPNKSGEPATANANAGFHNRPATRAGPYDKKMLIYPTELNLFYFYFQAEEIYKIQVFHYQVTNGMIKVNEKELVFINHQVDNRKVLKKRILFV
jgi:hypothetical protein